MIKVFLVDDSPLACKIIRKIISSAPDIQVIGEASNGKEALRIIPVLTPDVVCIDFKMPIMDGLELTKRILEIYPVPILIISISVQSYQKDNIFQLLSAGALDIIPKPRSYKEGDYQIISHDLISKIKIVSGVKVIRHKPLVAETLEIPPSGLGKIIPSSRIVAIGASTGGPQTLESILTQLPADFPLPVICIQHIDDYFLKGMVNWLSSICKMKVMIAKHGDLPQSGTIYFPPPGSYLSIDIGGKFMSFERPQSSNSLNTIDITFSSIAQYYGNTAIGIILTGMGTDGVNGLLKIAQAGGITIAQNEASSIIFGMPKEAINIGAAKHILSPPEITTRLLSLYH